MAEKSAIPLTTGSTQNISIGSPPTMQPGSALTMDGTRFAAGSEWIFTPRGRIHSRCKEISKSNYNETLTIPSLNPPYSSTFPNDGDYKGGNLLGRWNHSFSRSS